MRSKIKEQKRRKKREIFFNSLRVQLKLLNVPNAENLTKIQLSRFNLNSSWLESLGFTQIVAENGIWWVKGRTNFEIQKLLNMPKYHLEQFYNGVKWKNE